MNFTAIDVCKVLVGLFLFVPFALCPGYVIGWLSDSLAFRSRSVGEKLLIAVLLSISTVPLFIYLTGRFGSMTLVWSGIAAAFAIFLLLFARDLRRQLHPFGVFGWPLAAVTCWIGVGLASLVDFHWKDRLYIAASTFDYALRNQITESITRTGVTPWNPLFFPGHPVPLRYHYFWFLPCSMVSVLSGGWVGPGPAIMAGTLWCGFGLMALVVIYVWYFRCTEGQHSRRRAWTGLALLCVTGLDILPVLLLMSAGIVLFIIDKWNEEIEGWFISLLWAPHYVAGVITCLTGFLILWKGATRDRTKQIGGIVVAGIAFASSTGTAIYVSLVFAASLIVLALIYLWKRWWNDAIGIAIAGALAGILAAPYLMGLIAVQGSSLGTTAAAGSTPGHTFIIPTVRSFLLVDALMAAVHAGPLLISLVNVLLLPLNYLLELGVFFVVGIVQARRYFSRRTPLGRKEWPEVVLIGIPVLICSFFRSSVIENNDLGWRGFLIPQFMLLLWSIDYVRFSWRKKSRLLAVEKGAPLFRLRSRVIITLFLGAASTLFGFALNRAYMPGFDFGWNHGRSWLYPAQVLGKRVLALRETYEWVNQNTPSNAILLRSPEIPDLSYGIYSKRQTVAADAGCATFFGGSMEECREVLAQTLPLFTAQLPADDPDIETPCKRYFVSMIVVKDIDPAWRNPKSWVWKRNPVFSNGYSRVFTCNP